MQNNILSVREVNDRYIASSYSIDTNDLDSLAVNTYITATNYQAVLRSILPPLVNDSEVEKVWFDDFKKKMDTFFDTVNGPKLKITPDILINLLSIKVDEVLKTEVSA